MKTKTTKKMGLGSRPKATGNKNKESSDGDIIMFGEYFYIQFGPNLKNPVILPVTLKINEELVKDEIEMARPGISLNDKNRVLASKGYRYFFDYLDQAKGSTKAAVKAWRNTIFSNNILGDGPETNIQDLPIEYPLKVTGRQYMREMGDYAILHFSRKDAELALKRILKNAKIPAKAIV